MRKSNRALALTLTTILCSVCFSLALSNSDATAHAGQEKKAVEKDVDRGQVKDHAPLSCDATQEIFAGAINSGQLVGVDIRNTGDMAAGDCALKVRCLKREVKGGKEVITSLDKPKPVEFKPGDKKGDFWCEKDGNAIQVECVKGGKGNCKFQYGTLLKPANAK